METRYFTRRALALGCLPVALALGTIANGCRREPSMASRSAAAYQEAVDQGLPIGSGHGGHDGGESPGHSGVTTPEGGAPPEHGDVEAEEHPAKASDGSASAAGTHHSEPAGGAASMASADHAALGHGSPAPIPQSRPSPTSSSQIGRLDPSGTLSPDQFDRTVAAPSNAGSAASGQDTEHQGHGTPSPALSLDSASPKGAAAPDPAEAAFTCPMHPEVRSSQPGTCHKCGMTLVKKEKP